MPKKIKQKPILTIPKGYDIEDLFDTDDSDFNEPPIKTEEVTTIFGEE